MKTHFIILIASLILASCQQPETNQANTTKVETVPVRVARVTKKELLIPITSQGKLTAGAESQLSFKIPGIIDGIYVNEGQEVKKGQLLASLDKAEINAQVNQAKAALNKTERDLNRMKNLYEDKVITLEALQNSETAFDVATSDFEIASFNKKYAVISAPADGQILDLKSEENEIVKSGTVVFEFANTQHSWIIKAGLIDRELVKIVQGDSAVVYFDALPTIPFQAVVSLIPNAPKSSTGTFEVEISLKKYDTRLRSGFYGKVNIYPSQRNEYTIVPLVALVEGDGRNGIVYAPSGDGVVAHKVRVEEFVVNEIAISGDVDKLEFVVTDGVEDLTATSEIEIVQ